LVVLVAVQLSVLGLYLAPVFNTTPPAGDPPQTIILPPAHTAVWEYRAEGALVVLVAVQLSVPGLYLPPVLEKVALLVPPQTIIKLPVHTVV